ncbi:MULTISPECIES: beta-ketoacyl-ACP synthase 3 [unclassified Streptomyces]|uniref:beta-ketoacyl-ACP synthase 3 n=1 Tax=unclassified Streptomyces TaxID=2593676 RepID=UPI0033C5E2BF
MPSPTHGTAAERTAVLEGLAGVVPPRAVSNDDLPAAWDTDDAWVRRRTGIRVRHWVAPGVSTGDLALEAARRALAVAAAAPVRPLGAATTAPVDAVVVATSTPDRPMPAMAPQLAHRLGLGPVAAWDVAAACSGFVYALAGAAGAIGAGIANRVLVVAAEVYSTLIAPDDRGAGVVFADGAGAVVLRRGEQGEPGSVLGFDLGSDGAGHELIEVPGGGALARSAPDRYTPADLHFKMRGRDVFQEAVTRMTLSAQLLLKNVGWSVHDIDRFVAHQANARILNAVAERIPVPSDRQVANIDRVGNTGAASIPLALADAAEHGRLHAGQRVLLTSFGAGLTWGSAALLWPDLAPVPSVHSTDGPPRSR